MAYLNFQNCTRQQYEDTLYSQDAKHKIKILFNNVELQDADRYCEKFNVKPRIIENGSKSFSLNAFVAKEAELILHNIDTSIIQDQISISIGTLVNNTYEYVPIGIFNIQDTPTTDKDKTTIKLRDNAVKFDFNYNAQPLIEENGGTATKLQILQDICSQANVTCNITSFIGYLDDIGIYDSTVKARQYVANIAEQAGKIATINRNGELIFVDVNDLTTWEIPIGVVEKYEVGSSYKIGKIVYEDGIVRYETADSNDDTLFLSGANNYINNELTKEQASSNNNEYRLENTGEAELAYLEMEGKTEQESEPTPDNPSELISVGYTNLFDSELEQGSIQSSTGINSSATNRVRTVSYIDVNNSTQYTINAATSLTKTIQTYIFEYEDDTTYIQRIPSAWVNLPYTFTTSANTKKIRIVFAYSDGSTTNVSEFSNMQLEKGTKAHDYIPYGKYGITIISHNKNIFTGLVKGIAISATNGGEYNSSAYATSDYINVDFNYNPRYYLSGLTNGLRSFIAAYNSNKQFLGRTGATGRKEILLSNTSFTGGTPQGTGEIAYLRVTTYEYSGSSETIDVVDTLSVQLEIGNQATSYQPSKASKRTYIISEPLRSIGNVKDLLYVKNDTLYIERKIGSVVLDGSENWGYNTANEVFNLANAVQDYIRTGFVPVSNYYLGQNITQYNQLLDNRIAFLQSTTQNRLVIKNTSITQNSNGIKTWLSTHNVEVQYVMTESSTEALGLVSLPNTYEEVTNISISSNINTNTYLQYRQNQTRLEAILEATNQLDIDSLKTGKILGNPAIDGYDLIQIHDTYKDETYTTLATSDLTYNGVITTAYDTQVEEEQKQQNVTISGEATFKKWATTKIDNVEGTISLQAGQINEANNKINETNLQISSQGALLNVIANNSNIDISYDQEGNPVSGEVTEVTTTTGFKFNAEGMTIEDSSTNFKALHRNTGTYYYDGDTITGQYTKDGSKQKDLELFGVYYYGKNDINDDPMFVAQLYTDYDADPNGKIGFGHFFNGGD